MFLILNEPRGQVWWLQQEAYKRIDEMTEDGVRMLIDIIDKMRVVSVVGFKTDSSKLDVEDNSIELSKEEKKKQFMESAGKIDIDGDAIWDLRERERV